MTLIVCTENRMGQAFHQRRLSRDRTLYSRIAAYAEGRTLRMSPYSRPLFADALERVERPVCLLAEEDYLERAEEGDLCFVEREDVTPYRENLKKIILYRWNRAYPSDLKFQIDLQDGTWDLVSSTEFPGFSHEKITEEMYGKN